MMEETNIAELIVEYIRNHFDIEPKCRKKPTREEILEYHKQYYLRNKDKIKCECICPHCEKTFTYKSAYTRHLMKSLRCKLKRYEAQLSQLESASSSEENPRSSSSSDNPPNTPAHHEQDFLN